MSTINDKKYCRVKFVNSKGFWFHNLEGDSACDLGDLDYCDGSQAGIVGKVVETSHYMNGLFYSVIEKIGHIELENEQDLDELWKNLSKEERINIQINLGAKEPFSKAKFMTFAGNTWTVKGMEGMEWNAYLDHIETLRCDPKAPEEDIPKITIDGYLCKQLDKLPEVREKQVGELFNGVVYGPREWIEPIIDQYDIYDISEYHYGVIRAKFNNNDLLKDHPELKVLFLESEGTECVPIKYPFTLHAAYSESGYPYITELKKEMIYFPGEDYSEIYRNYPDECFMEGSTDTRSGWAEQIKYRVSFDEQTKETNYVFAKDGQLFQIIEMEPENKEWLLTEKKDGTYISRYNGNSKDIVFPTEVDGKKIIGIDDRFGKIEKNYKQLESVIIPEGYKSIGASAFESCKKLKNVTLPDSLEVIGDFAFMKCESLEEIALPYKIKYLWDYYHDKTGGRAAFCDCKALVNVYTRYPEFDYSRYDHVFSGARRKKIQYAPKKDFLKDGYKSICLVEKRITGHTIGEKVILSYSESGCVDVDFVNGDMGGTLMQEEKNTIIPDLHLIGLLDDVEATIASDPFRFMLGYGVEILVKLR